SYDPTIHLWETATGRPRHRLAGHRGRIFVFRFAPDGKRLLSGSEDSTVLVWDLTGGPQGGAAFPPADLKARWGDVGSADAEAAYQAVRALTAGPGGVVAFLRERLHPVPEPDAKRVAGLIAALDRDSFAERERAARELEGLGSAVEPSLRQAVAGRA